MNYDLESLYIIRVRDEDKQIRISKLGELEQVLNTDERAQLEHIIEPISAAIAFIYDSKLACTLEQMGYELLKQEREKRIENE